MTDSQIFFKIKFWDIDTRDGQDNLFSTMRSKRKVSRDRRGRTFLYLNFSTQEIHFPMAFLLQISVFSNLTILLQCLLRYSKYKNIIEFAKP